MNHGVPAANNVAHAWSFDFDDFRAHVGEQAGRKRTGKHLFKSKDLDAVQRSAGFGIGCHCNLFYRLERFERLERLEPAERFKKLKPFQSFKQSEENLLGIALYFRKQILIRRVGFLPDHHAARIINYNFALLLNAPGANLDDAPLRFRF